MAIVTALKQQTRNPQRVNLYLDGHFCCSLSGALTAGLSVGVQLSDAEINELLDREAFEAAFQRSLHLISRRPHSTEEIRIKLRRKEVPEQVIVRVIDRLKDAALLDDQEFARAWVENRMAFRPRGRKLLHQELRERGVSKEIIESVLSNLDDEQAARQAAEKVFPRYRNLPEELAERRMLAYLARRGFTYSVCRRVSHATLQAARVSVGESEAET